MDITDIGEDKGIVYTAEVQLRPTVTLGQYKGIEIPRQAYTVTEEEVDMALRSEQEAQARYVDVERPVADKDRVLLCPGGPPPAAPESPCRSGRQGRRVRL